MATRTQPSVKVLAVTTLLIAGSSAAAVLPTQQAIGIQQATSLSVNQGQNTTEAGLLGGSARTEDVFRLNHTNSDRGTDHVHHNHANLAPSLGSLAVSGGRFQV